MGTRRPPDPRRYFSHVRMLVPLRVEKHPQCVFHDGRPIGAAARGRLLAVNVAVQLRQEAQRHAEVHNRGGFPLRPAHRTFLGHGAFPSPVNHP